MTPVPVDPRHFAALYEKAFAERAEKFGERDARTAEVARSLGLFLSRQGDRAGAEIWLRRALGIAEASHAPRSREVATAQEALAHVTSGESERQELHRQASQCDDPAVAARNLAALAALQGDDVSLYRQALAKQEQASGRASAQTALRLNDLGLALDPPQAIPLFRRALAINEATLGRQHPETGTTLNNLSNALLAIGQAAAAEPLQRRALIIFTESLGPLHERTGIATSNLGEVLAALGRNKDAVAQFLKAHSIFRHALGPDHAWTREAAAKSGLRP
jgi:tetratricopeptide (TPR) repeat protein